MADLNCNLITGMLKSDFGALWHCQQLGNTLEITTPYLYPDDSFVTIYVTKRGDRFIISDAGQVSEFFQPIKDDEAFLESLIAKSRWAHDVKVYKQGNKTFYFKETNNAKLISSIAFDMVGFLMGASSAASLSVSEEESADKNSFRSRADRYIKHQVPRGRTVSFNKKLPEVKEVTFSAVITANSRLWVVIYLTGSNLKYFQLNVANAIVNVEFTQLSRINDKIAAIIPFLNNDAEGYQPRHLTQRLAKLEDLTHNKVIPWDRKEDIIAQIA